MGDLLEKMRLGTARLFVQMMQDFDEMTPEKQRTVREAIGDCPTHPDVMENDEAIRTIAEAFYPDMKGEECRKS